MNSVVQKTKEWSQYEQRCEKNERMVARIPRMHLIPCPCDVSYQLVTTYSMAVSKLMVYGVFDAFWRFYLLTFVFFTCLHSLVRVTLVLNLPATFMFWVTFSHALDCVEVHCWNRAFPTPRCYHDTVVICLFVIAVPALTNCYMGNALSERRLSLHNDILGFVVLPPAP